MVYRSVERGSTKRAAREQETFQDYFRRCAAAIGLGHYSFNVEPQPYRVDESLWASVEVHFFDVRVRACLGLFKRPPEFVREIVAHELIHVVLDDIDNYVSTLRGDESVYERLNEMAVRRLQKAVAEALPLPAGEIHSLT